MAGHYPDEARSAGDGGHRDARPSSASAGPDHSGHDGTCAKLQDSYVYYAELLVAVDGHSLLVPQPRAAPDDRDQDPGFGDTCT